MLTITIPLQEGVDDKNNFVTVEGTVLEFEHSLVSLSKWESIFEKPFLGKDEKTPEETLAYYKAMCLTENVPDYVWDRLSKENLMEINDYIGKKMTATWVNENPNAKKSTEVITSELVYYWMIALNIPFECQTWHLNRLLMLIRVCNAKNGKPQKMSRKDAIAQRKALNAQRKLQHNTSG